MKRVLIDTNTLLSGLFFRGNERRLLELALDENIQLVLPEIVEVETREVVQRKFLGRKNSKEAAVIFKLILGLSESVGIEETKKGILRAKALIRDESDAPILAAALHALPDCLLTGDNDFFHLKGKTPFKKMRVRNFLEETEGRK